MKPDWSKLLAVRDLRARLAERQAMDAKHSVARAEESIREVRLRKESHERMAQQASAMVSAQDAGRSLLVGEARRLLEFASGQRFKAHEGQAQIRRAELVMERAREYAAAAAAEHRMLVFRREAVAQKSERQRRAVDARQQESEGEIVAEWHTVRATAAAAEVRPAADESAFKSDRDDIS